MKKALLPALIVLFALFLILPILNLIALLTGYGFEVYNEILISSVLAVLAVAEAVGLLVTRIRLPKTGRVFAILILPASLLNAACFIGFDWLYGMIFAAICCVCALLIFIKCSDDCYGKAASAVASIFAVIGIIILFIVETVFGRFLSNMQFEKSLSSPSGKLEAVVYTKTNIISEKSVIMISTEEGKKGAVIGYFFIKPYEIYEGEATDIHTARIDWISDEAFVINGTAYKVGVFGLTEEGDEERSEDAEESYIGTDSESEYSSEESREQGGDTTEEPSE